MAAKKATGPVRHFGPIDVERIFLYEQNPRHEPIESEPEIIEYLCKDEQVFNLARNISEAGANPLVLLGLVEITSPHGGKKSYQVWEGNRRICAIKLLNDPDLAPAHLRKDFKRLADQSAHVPIEKINAVVFDDHDDLKYWMGISRITLYRKDALKFIDLVENKLPEETFLCIDPPYFQKGSRLYTSFYNREDHEKVADRILKLDSPWILTYDYCDEIHKLYSDRRQFQYCLNYSAQEKRLGTELLIASKGLRIPDDLKAAQVHRPQYRTAA